MATLTPQQLAQMFAGNGPMAMPAYTMDDIYGGILPSMGGGNPALNAINAATPTAPMAPASWSAYDVATGDSLGSSAASLPRTQPSYTPPTYGMERTPAAAVPAARPAVTSVSGTMKPTGWGGFDLMSLLTGPSKNGLGGLAGLLGGPQHGGILQTLFGGGKSTAGLPRQPAAMTSAQRYAALNSGPGSVAAMERLHSGQSRNPQSGGPASGGEYASGGR